MLAGRDGGGDQIEMMLHRFDIRCWHDQRRRLALGGTSRAKHVGRLKLLLPDDAGRLPLGAHVRVSVPR